MPNLIAFSTLGCPAWDLDRIITAAQEYGYDAVELRGYLDSMDLPTAGPFAPERRTETRARFADAGIAICCVSSSGVVTKGNCDHVRSHAELANGLGCPYVRVFGGALEEGIPREEAFNRAVANLRMFGDAAREEGVRVVLETHDSFSSGKDVAKLLAAANHPWVMSLWDLHHPYRQGEAINATYDHLAPTLAHLHIKDSRATGDYCLLGEGDIPLFPMLDLVLDGGYQGAISLEWEKRWHPEIADPNIAFPQYVRGLREYLSGRRT